MKRFIQVGNDNTKHRSKVGEGAKVSAFHDGYTNRLSGN